MLEYFRTPWITRRECVAVLGTAAGAMVLPTAAEAAEAPANRTPITIQVNHLAHRLTIDPRVTLLDLLREHLALTGTKKGCDHGQCGACTVLVNGRRINSCLSLAVTHDGDEITTVEGLAQGHTLQEMQAAFIEHDGFQCGYCTPGQLCSAVAMLQEAQRGDPSFVTVDLKRAGRVDLTDDEIRERMSGNICRCGAYAGIVAAIKAVNEDTSSASRSKGGRL
jgi:xanthine dehydrogenase YagT iron-sulfur-binding subunit